MKSRVHFRASSRWRRPGRWIPLLVVSLAFFTAITYLVLASSGVERELALVRARGLPVTPNELDTWYHRVPASENAAHGFLEAYQSHVDPSADKDPSNYSWRDMPIGKPLPADVAAAAEDYVGKNGGVLRLIHAASKSTWSRYPTDLSKAPDISFSHLLPVKHLVSLLRWEIVLKAEDRDAVGMLQALLSGFVVSASLSDEPLLISELVRMACLAIHLDALARAVTTVQFDEQQLAQLSAALRKAEEDGRRALFRAMAGERVFALASFNMTYDQYAAATTWGGSYPAFDDLPDALRKTLFYFRRGSGMHNRDQIFYLQGIAALEQAATLDFTEMLTKTDSAISGIAVELDRHPFRYLLSNMVLPSLSLAAEKEVLLAARLRCARMALSIEQFRGQNGGGLPREDQSVLKDLPEFGRDPVDQQPLDFQLTAPRGYRIIANAATRRSNKGRSGTNSNDVAFTVGR